MVNGRSEAFGNTPPAGCRRATDVAWTLAVFCPITGAKNRPSGPLAVSSRRTVTWTALAGPVVRSVETRDPDAADGSYRTNVMSESGTDRSLLYWTYLDAVCRPVLYCGVPPGRMLRSHDAARAPASADRWSSV